MSTYLCFNALISTWLVNGCFCGPKPALLILRVRSGPSARTPKRPFHPQILPASSFLTTQPILHSVRLLTAPVSFSLALIGSLAPESYR